MFEKSVAVKTAPIRTKSASADYRNLNSRWRSHAEGIGQFIASDMAPRCSANTRLAATSGRQGTFQAASHYSGHVLLGTQ